MTRVRWTPRDTMLISAGGNDTAIIIWENKTIPSQPADLNKSLNTEIVQRNRNKGESDDSDTDDEDEGYDSDVRREHNTDFTRNIFTNIIKKPAPELIKNMQNDAIAIDKT